jgi:glycerol uptake facilitator protein
MTPFIAELIGFSTPCIIRKRCCSQRCLKRYKGNNSGWIVITTAWALAVL